MWKVQPPTPLESGPSSGVWYVSSTENIQGQIITDWEQGKDLEDMVPRLTLDDLLPAPKDNAIISLITAKTEPYIHQKNQNNHQ